jgi:hypothetical protein
MLVPVMVFIWVYRLAYYRRDFRRRLAYGGEETIPRIDPAERPAFVLKYNNASQKTKAWMSVIAFLFICLFCFFLAGKSARHDVHHLFFSLGQEETYFLYYWAWRFNFMSWLLLVLIVIVKILFVKQVSFFRNAVVLENFLLGRKALALDDNARVSKSERGDIWLYNQMSMRHMLIVNRQFMTLDWGQNRLLDDIILKRIPEKKERLLV